MESSEGYIPFHVTKAGKTCHTWYRIFGDLSPQTNSTPLIAIHGGPGACHEYVLPMTDMTKDFGIPMIFYDQIGNGKSTRLPSRAGDNNFWAEDLFHDELDNLIDFFNLRERPGGFDVIGHSWGGQLASKWAARHPEGLRRLVVADSPASTVLQLKGEHPLRKALPQEVQETLDRCERDKDFESMEYEEACLFFYKRHLCRLDPWPDEVKKAHDHFREDPTVYKTMIGPSELYIDGALKNWTAMDTIHNVQAATLLINGRYSLMQDIAIRPYFEQIPRVKWITLEKSSLMGHLEERERFTEVVASFLGADQKSS